MKAAELASVQRLEAAELRKQEEKARRLEQARARTAAEMHLREKVAAATFARSYIKGEWIPCLSSCTYVLAAPACGSVSCSDSPAQQSAYTGALLSPPQLVLPGLLV